MRKPTMSNATETVRSTRADARAFAEAFSDADDAFTFETGVAESRELSLDELGEVLGLGGGGPASNAPRPVVRASRVEAVPSDDGEQLLTLDELGDALARGEQTTEDLDFDFGTSANERARRRTAARLGAPDPASVPARAQPTTASTGRTVVLETSGIAAASAATAARMAAPGRAVAAPRPAARLREIERPARPPKAFSERFGGNPDRIAMWAVLLGIVLILIAFTSGSAGAVALPLVSVL